MLKRQGYGLLVAAGMLISPLAMAQESAQAQKPQASTAGQPQGTQPCEMMGGMHGGMKGQGRMGHGMGGAGMSCPMMGMADVKVEQTPTGAILRLTAKSPDQVAQVQQHARMMERCMSGEQQPESSPSQKK